jgi:hypothetical protein
MRGYGWKKAGKSRFLTHQNAMGFGMTIETGGEADPSHHSRQFQVKGASGLALEGRGKISERWKGR